MDARKVDIAASVAVVLGGVALTFIHYYGGSPGSPEGKFAALGFASPFIGAGLLAMVGALRGRPALMFAAGAALIPMSVLSIVLIPLILPAVWLIARSTRERFDTGDLATPAILASSLVAVLAFVVFHQDPVTWSTPEGGGSSSDIVTTLEAAIAILATAAVALIAAFRPAPQHQTR